MSRHALSVISMVVLSGLSSAAWSDAAGATVSDTYSAATQAGLVSVQSRYLDEVYLKPAADFVGYRKVLIDPVQVALRPNWRRPTRRKSCSRRPTSWPGRLPTYSPPRGMKS